MTRRFFQTGIAELEALFTQNNSNVALLEALAEELEHRTTERARRLKADVSDRLDAVCSGKAQEMSPLPSKPVGDRPVSEPTPPSSTPAPPKSWPTPNAVFNPPDSAARPTPAPPPRAAKPTRPVTDRPDDILSAWTALEVLSPAQPYKRPADMAAGGEWRVAHFAKFKAPPWSGDGEKSRPKKRLFYQVVLGAIKMEQATSALMSVFVDKHGDRQTVRGFAPIAVITLDRKGCPSEEPSVVVSSFAWGLPIALTGDLASMGDWAAMEARLTKLIDDHVRCFDKDGKPTPVGYDTIKSAYDLLVRTLGLTPDLLEPPSFAVRTYHFMYAKEPPDPPILNSFFLKDLAATRKMAKEDKLPQNLRKYLGVEKPATWRDVLKDDGLVEDAVAPSMMPLGRWPAPGRHPLVLLQQAAVNLATSQKISSLVAVNGPPGTGKTTLLRDVVAALVVQRAEAMCAFDDPEQAFTGGAEHVIDRARVTLSRVHPTLRGFEMLVTSSNNAAVENVSRELPSVSAVADDAAGLRYFKTVGDRVSDKVETWGLIAAVLGNSSNRYEFRERFWVDDDFGMQTYLCAAQGISQMIEEPDPVREGAVIKRTPIVIEREAPPKDKRAALKRWAEARRAFMAALSQMKARLAELEAGRQAALRVRQHSAAKAEAEAKASGAAMAVRSAAADVESASSRQRKELEKLRVAAAAVASHDAVKPGLFARMFGTQTAKDWRSQMSSLKSAHSTSGLSHDQVTEVLDDYKKRHAKALHVHAQASAQYEAATAAHAKTEAEIQGARNRCGKKFVDGDFFKRHKNDLHQDSAWLDCQLNQERDRVFELAMALHRAFIDAAASPIQDNLEILMRTFYSKLATSPHILPLMPHVWSTLFLVVPVVSTTFASVERMLGYLPPESLGWLLVDEAGQAVPQAVVGAMMRAKRAIIVGDPQQIEPVTTLPTSLTEAICSDFGVNPTRWSASSTSVQSVADATSTLGTEFRRPVGTVRVGLPLLVHRRCAEPMFTISNDIAYSGLMVHAVADGRPSPIRDVLGPSHWIDVTPVRVADNWSEQEGEAVLGLLRALGDAGLDLAPDLYIVTPFRVVAKNLRDRIRASGLLERWTDDPDAWVKTRVGTVHTVQGREADSVFFVLGAPLSSQNGARSWASGQVNLLNVAVTRAKENLYVIGCRPAWEDSGNFKTLAGHVSLKQPKAAAAG
jgi:hypothetical protein